MIDNRFIVKKIQNLSEVIAVFYQPTRMPFVECDPETFDDLVHIFTDEKEVQEFAKGYIEKKILLRAMKVPQAQTLGFFTGFYSIGVNMIVFHENETEAHVPLEEIVKKPDINKMMQEKVPMINSTLQLSAIYFLQEMYRPVEHNTEHAKELEEELIANLQRSKYILALENAEEGKDWDPKDKNQKNRISYVKDKQDSLLLPIFTDFTEFKKFYANRIAKVGIAVITFEDLPKYLVEKAKGIVINPAGFHLYMGKEQLEMLPK